MRRRPPKLHRRGASRDPKRQIVIVCEGELAEPSYFHPLARHCSALVSVERAAGVPLSVVKKAIALKRRANKGRNSFERRDQFWAVFDRDEHPKFAEAINKAESAGINVCYSNPCFELWLVLHYQDYDRPCRRDEIQRVLRDLMTGYDPDRTKQVNFEEIRQHIEKAERRAELQEQRRNDEQSPRENPCTNVFKLTRSIRL